MSKKRKPRPVRALWGLWDGKRWGRTKERLLVYERKSEAEGACLNQEKPTHIVTHETLRLRKRVKELEDRLIERDRTVLELCGELEKYQYTLVAAQRKLARLAGKKPTKKGAK